MVSTPPVAPRFDPAPKGWVQPVTLEGRAIRLEPLTLEHLDDLAEVAFEGNLWRWTAVQPSNVSSRCFSQWPRLVCAPACESP